jgi:hypothetical protein
MKPISKIISLTAISLSLSLTLTGTANADTDWGNVIGTTAGAAAGGVIGYQFGGGRGKYVTTAVGSLIGGAIGNNVAGGDGYGFRKEEPQPYYQEPQGYYQEPQPYYEEPQPYYKEANYNYSNNNGQDSYNNQGSYNNQAFVDDYLIKQKRSDDAKRRNMVRNGELDPRELSYDTSETQTSWDDPNN